MFGINLNLVLLSIVFDMTFSWNIYVIAKWYKTLPTISPTKTLLLWIFFLDGWGKIEGLTQIEKMRCQNVETSITRIQYWIVTSATNSFPILIKIIRVWAAAARVEKLIAVSYCRCSRLTVGMDQSWEGRIWLTIVKNLKGLV